MDMRIALFPGDGIGPEIIDAAKRVLDRVAAIYGHSFVYENFLIGGASIDAVGAAISDETLKNAKKCDSILLGAVGGPKWDDPNATVRPEQGLLRLRKEMGVFANLRPVKTYPRLYAKSPIKDELLRGVDILVIRELTGGIYFGKKRQGVDDDGVEWATDELSYSETEISRILEFAFRSAQDRRGLVTSVDKANVLNSSRLWRKTAAAVAERYPDVRLEHMLVDTASMRLISNPRDIDVLVTENMFGDILTDEASVLSGSMGMLASASVGTGSLGIYEPIHGSAPDIAGKVIANPIGTILSAALMLRCAFGLTGEAEKIEAAVEETIAAGELPLDLGGSAGTRALTDQILNRI